MKVFSGSRDVGLRCLGCSALPVVRRSVHLVLIGLLGASAVAAHRFDANSVTGCIGGPTVQAKVGELFGDSSTEGSVVLSTQLPGQPRVEGVIGNWNINGADVGDAVATSWGEIPPPMRPTLREAADASLDVRVEFAGNTFGESDVFLSVETQARICDSISFLQTSVTFASGVSEVDVMVGRKVEPDARTGSVTTTVEVGNAVLPGDCGFASFEVVGNGELGFMGSESKSVRLRRCPQPISGSFDLGGVLTLKETANTSPSTIIEPREIEPIFSSGTGRALYDSDVERVVSSGAGFGAPTRGALPPLSPSFVDEAGVYGLFEPVAIGADPPSGPFSRELDIVPVPKIVIEGAGLDAFFGALRSEDALPPSASGRLKPVTIVTAPEGGQSDRWLGWWNDRPDARTPPHVAIEAEGDILDGAVNNRGSAAFLVGQDDVLRLFVLSQLDSGTTVSSQDVSPLPVLPSSVSSLGNGTWAVATPTETGLSMRGVSDLGVELDQIDIELDWSPVPGASFGFVPTPGSRDATTVVLVSNFLVMLGDFDGALEVLKEMEVPGVESPDGFAANDSYVSRHRVRRGSFGVLPPNVQAEETLGVVVDVFDWDGNLVDSIPVEAGASDPVARLNSQNELVVVYTMPDGVYAKAYRLPDRPTTCVPSSTTLCLGRYEVSGVWADQEGNRKRAEVTQVTPNTGYFTFLDETNPEIFFKILDIGCSFPGDDPHTWIFGGGLTSLWSEFTVLDTVTGQSKSYANPAGRPYLPIRDVEALGNCDSVLSAKAPNEPEAAGTQTHRSVASLDRSEVGTSIAGSLFSEVDRSAQSGLSSKFSAPTVSALPKASFANCTETDTKACLTAGRFELEIDYATASGTSGAANLVRITPDGAYGWFFSDDNVEVFVKILDACAITNSYWLFAAGLTDVEVTIRVTDTSTGAMRTYEKSQGTDFVPILEFGDFTACSV